MTSEENFTLTTADLVASEQEGDTVSSGTRYELAAGQIGTGGDGQLTDYKYIEVGHPNPDELGPRGKLYADLRDNDGNSVDGGVRFRFVARSRNANRVKAVSEWVAQRDANEDRPDHRIPFHVKDASGKETIIQESALVAVEVRSPNDSVEVSLDESTIEAPCIGGY